MASRPKFSASASASLYPASSSSSCNAGLVLTKVVLVASLSVIRITSFTLRFSLTRDTLLEELVFLKCNDCHPASALILL